MTKIKICGITQEKEIEAVNILKPDYVGFVFAEGSRRFVTIEKAMQLRNDLNKDIKVVGVFVDAPIEHIVALCKQNIIDVIQLHGKESHDYIKELRYHTAKRIMKAYEIKAEADIENANKSIADYILLDHGAGGTGECFNWSLLAAVKRSFLLAGGLNPNNVEEAIKAAAATDYLYGIDTSSGVETNGTKDFQKIEKMIQAVRESKER